MSLGYFKNLCKTIMIVESTSIEWVFTSSNRIKFTDKIQSINSNNSNESLETEMMFLMHLIQSLKICSIMQEAYHTDWSKIWYCLLIDA